MSLPGRLRTSSDFPVLSGSRQPTLSIPGDKLSVCPSPAVRRGSAALVADLTLASGKDAELTSDLRHVFLGFSGACQF